MSDTKLPPHTPTPYRVGAIIDEGAIRIEGGDGPHIGVMRFSDNPLLTRERAIANAEFFVLAANHHDELVAALRDCKTTLEAICLPESETEWRIVHVDVGTKSIAEDSLDIIRPILARIKAE